MALYWQCIEVAGDRRLMSTRLVDLDEVTILYAVEVQLGDVWVRQGGDTTDVDLARRALSGDDEALSN